MAGLDLITKNKNTVGNFHKFINPHRYSLELTIKFRSGTNAVGKSPAGKSVHSPPSIVCKLFLHG